MNEIEKVILILNRVNRCSKALNMLHLAKENLIFKENLNNEKHTKYAAYVLSLINEAIFIIEDDETNVS